MRSRRLPRCSCCALPQPLCVGAVPRIEARTPVVLVTHRTERWKSSNSGRLVARLCTSAALHLHGDPVQPPAAPRVVLFPAEGARLLAPTDAGATLVVLDGTWPQARRMMRRDGWAAGAEAVRLPAGPGSRYRLRRSARDEGLCTLEAVAHALAIVEDPAIAERLLRALDDFVERATALRRGRLPIGGGRTYPDGELRGPAG
jgi:DTW domain-containing protein YfiP